jgi:hydrogenase nickel incorporation protein HypA/HybF
MHEMTLLTSVTRIVAEEMENSGLTRLTRVPLKSGALAGLVPEAMRFAWQVLAESGPLMGVELAVEHEPVRLRCGGELGHTVLAGREVFIESIEGEAESEAAA